MDLFEIPDDYKPQKPLTDQEMDEITNYLKGHPLFLKEIPQDVSNNQHIVALQSLNQEQDPQDRAQNLNKQANNRLKQGPNSPFYMKDAYIKYTQAINLKQKKPHLNAKLHCNRAAINLKYKNYGKVIQDCKQCINFDPTYIKGYYRMGKAFIALKKYQQCIDLLKTQTDPQLIALSIEATAMKQQQKQLNKQLEEKIVMAQNKIQEYFSQKKWRLCKRNQQLPEGVEIQFIDQKISIPLIIIYPEFNQFDLIAKTEENQKLSESLKQLFSNPLPWDQKGDYTYNTIQIYTEVEEAVLLKLPKQATISEIAARAPIKGAIEITILANNSFSEIYKNQFKIY